MTTSTWAPGMRGAVASVALLLARETKSDPPNWAGDWLLRDDPDAVLQRIRTHKLVLAVLPILSELPLTASQRSNLVAVARSHRLRALVLAADQVAAVEALTAAAIPVVSLKGLAFAAQTTGDFAGRVTGDIDLLVAPQDVMRATLVLQDAGVCPDVDYCPTPESPLFRATQRALKASLLHTAHADLDLHWRLDVARECCSATFDELMARSVEVDVGGSPIRTLGAIDAAIFNASHGTTDAWASLRQIVDQVRIDRLAPESQAHVAAVTMGARTRYEVSRAMVAPIVGGSPIAGIKARALANTMWEMVAAGRDVRSGSGVKEVSYRLVLQLGAAYDSPKAALQRLVTAGWPVQHMAARRLGLTGDRIPATYLALGVVHIPRRISHKTRTK